MGQWRRPPWRWPASTTGHWADATTAARCAVRRRWSTTRAAHKAGSPEEDGPHGCTLVQVDENGQSRTHLVPTDAIRWLSQRVVIDESTSRDDLESLLRQRLHTLLEGTPKLDLMVSWTVAGSGPLVTQLRRGKLAGELLAVLRSEHGFASPAAWSVSMEVESLAGLPSEWFEQETIRGDFLPRFANSR